jgi:SAM-dependent methyltransferase
MRLRHDLSLARVRGIWKVLWTSYGWKTPVVVSARLGMYLWHRLFRARQTFALDGRRYPYAVNLQNATFRCERAVEIPLALTLFPLEGEILEVGNVLSQYRCFPHDIVDKYEAAEGVQNVDIAEYQPDKRYDLILSVSTFEHVGWDETPRDPEKVVRALRHVASLLKPGGRLLVTVPTGYNDVMDRELRRNGLGFARVFYLRRVSRMNDWEATTCEDALARRYGSRYPCANAIAVGVLGPAAVEGR